MDEKEKLTIVLASGEMDKALSAFILATTGASMGMEVSVYFTFWGLNIIKKYGVKTRNKGLKRRVFSIINRGGAKRAALSKFHMFGIGTWMMRQIMREMNMPSLDEMITMAHEMGVKIIACTTTSGLMALPEDAFRSEVDVVAGAAYFLNEARQSKVTLFI